MRKIIIIQFILFIFCFYNCKENSIQNKTVENKIIEDTIPNSNGGKEDSFFTFKNWNSIDKSKAIYQSPEFLVKLNNYLDEEKNVGGKKVYINNKEIDFIITDAYVLTPFLFIAGNEKILLIQEEDEGGIYGYIVYYFENEKCIKRDYLNISPVEENLEIDKFIRFSNDSQVIKPLILTHKYYDTNTDEIKSSNQYTFIINKTIEKNINNSVKHNDINVKQYSFYGLFKTDCNLKGNVSNISFNNEKEGYLYLYDNSKLVAKMMIELSDDKKSLQYIGVNIIGERFDTSKLASLKKRETIATFEIINNNLQIFWIGFSQEKFLTKNPFGKENSSILKKCD